MIIFSDLFELKVGYMMQRVLDKDETGEAIPIISHKNLSLSALNLEDVTRKPVKPAFYEKFMHEKLLRKNDILVSLVYPYHSIIVTEELEGCIVSNFCAILRAKHPEEVDINYMHQLLSSDIYVGEGGKFQACLNEKSKATAVISLKKLGEQEVNLPSLEMQKKRAGVIRDIYTRIDLLYEMIKAEDHLKNVLLEGSDRTAALYELTELIKQLNRAYDKWTHPER